MEENRPGFGSEIKKSTGKAFPNPFFCGIVKYKFGRRLEEQSMKKLTINEIAEKAGVSKTTVSFYLNGKANKMSEETQQRIQQIIDETGYEPRAMKAKSSGLIGVILKDAADPYCARALKGMGEAAGETEYQILIGSSGYTFKNEREHVERMLKAGAEGFIIQATYRFGMLAGELEKKRKPIIYLEAKPYDFKGRYVKGNNYDCVYQVITECIKKGYGDFLMISDGESSMGTAFENTAGYRDALQDAGLEGRTLYVQSGARSAQIFEALKDELDLSLHTLIYVAAPELLKAVFQALRSLPDYERLFPEHLGLIGFDPEGWTRMTSPPVSAIIPPAQEEGKRAMTELLELLDGKKKDTEVVFKNIVKWRGTTV